jgi:transcriptional regulator with XRE-family HTH domain
MEWDKLVEKYQKDSELTDAQVAIDIGLSPQHFSNFKAGRRELTSGAKYNLINRLGYEFTRDIALALLPEAAQKKIKAVDKDRWKKKLEKKVKSESRIGEDSELKETKIEVVTKDAKKTPPWMY